MMEAIVSVLGAALLAIAGWGVHLNSRVAVIESDSADMDKRLLNLERYKDNIANRIAVLEADKTSLKELIGSQLNDISRRLGRIEAKLDYDTEERDK